MSSTIRLDLVSKLYGGFAAIRKLSAEFESGRCTVILGENGAGKSTLLRLIAGLIRPTLGTIQVFGGFSPCDARGRIGYMSHASMLYEELTGRENLEYFAALYPRGNSIPAGEALRSVGLDPSLPRPVGQYSQGMRQRASLARVLMFQPELLLLDEPFSNMDAASAQQMIALLDRVRSTRTILLTTHQPELARPIADRYCTMHAGQIASFADPDADLAREFVDQAGSRPL